MYRKSNNATILLASHCSLALGTPPALARAVGPALARVVLCGVRGSLAEFDGAGRAAVERSPVRLVSPGSEAERDVALALGDEPVYVHLDPDVLDQAENPVPYARSGGLSSPGSSRCSGRCVHADRCSASS